MLCARPSGEVVAALGDQPQREVRAEAVDLGDVLFAKQLKSAARTSKSGRVRLSRRCRADVARWQRTGVTTTTDAQFLQHGFRSARRRHDAFSW